MDSENTIFINKLNYVTKNFQETHTKVKSLWGKQDDVKLQIDDVDLQVKDAKDDLKFLTSRLDVMEQSLPKMVRELIEFYIDTKVQPQFGEFLTKKEYKDLNLNKLDSRLFFDWQKEQLQKEATNNKEHKVEERLYQIERQLHNSVSKEELKA